MITETMRFWTEALKPHEPLDWAIKNTITYENDSLFLRSFNSLPKVDKTPILILAPNAGHHENIAEPLIERCLKVDSDRAVYVVDWKEATPTSPNRKDSIDDLVRNVGECVKLLGNKVHLLTLCQGAWVGAIYAALYPDTVLSYTDAAGPIDFCVGGGKIQEMCQTLPMSFYENMVAAGGGVQKGEFQLYGFKAMNSYDRYVGDYCDLWDAVCAGSEKDIQKWHRFKDWYDQPKDLAGAWYLQAVDQLFRQNLLITGKLEILGQKVNLCNIKCPVFLIAGDKDDITLPDQVFALEKVVCGPVTKYVLTNAGHIGVFVKPASLDYWESAVLQNLNAIDEKD
jgi:polyhydroxyalkanoate depolymerase